MKLAIFPCCCISKPSLAGGRVAYGISPWCPSSRTSTALRPDSLPPWHCSPGPRGQASGSVPGCPGRMTRRCLGPLCFQVTTALTLCPRFGSMIAPQSRMADCPERNGAQAHGKHHDSQPRRRREDPSSGTGSGPRPIHGRGGAEDPAGCGWSKTEFPEPREHHPLALRAGQRGGPGIACARTRTRASVLRLTGRSP